MVSRPLGLLPGGFKDRSRVQKIFSQSRSFPGYQSILGLLEIEV